MSRIGNENREIILLITSFILVVAGFAFILGGAIGLFGQPSRVGLLAILAFAVTMLGIPAGISLTIGIILLILGVVCYRKANK